jgi:hypothetical protein
MTLLVRLRMKGSVIFNFRCQLDIQEYLKIWKSFILDVFVRVFPEKVSM